MGRRIIGALVGMAWVAAIGGLTGTSAGAGGGAYLQPDREFYRPGDVVHLSAFVTKLDRDWFGPYTVSLRSYGGTVPGADEGIPVGRLVVTRIDDTTVRAEVTFVLPKLPDGTWEVSYCSPGCDRFVGDLSGGLLVIGTEPMWTTGNQASATPAAPSTTTAPSTTAVAIPVDAPATSIASRDPAASTAAPASTAKGAGSATGSRSDGDARPWWWLAAFAGIVVLVASVIVVGRRSGPRRVVTTTGSALDGGTTDAVVAVPLEPVPAGPTDAAAPTIGASR